MNSPSPDQAGHGLNDTRRMAGIVICGGASRRMGKPKHRLPFGGATMLEHVLSKVAEVTAVQCVVLAANASDDEPVLPDRIRVVRDRSVNVGPLEGIARGLESIASWEGGIYEAAFVVPCDVPLLVSKFAVTLATELGDADVVAVDDGKRRHPLCAVYRTRVAVVAAKAINEGQRSLMKLLDRCNTRWLNAERFAECDPQLKSLRNINTPAEYQAAVDEAGF